MKTIVHRNNTRVANGYGWINMEASFRPDGVKGRINFGSLVNLDDAWIRPGEKEGFGFHPHKDMEIVSLILEGTMDHKDRGGNNAMIKSPGLQAITSGTGIIHNEVNGENTPLNMLQIWFLPNENGLRPDYGALEFTHSSYTNSLKEIISPEKEDGKISISQNVRMSIGQFQESTSILYKLKGEKHGVYIMILEGSAKVGDVELKKRDAIGVSEIKALNFQTLENNSKILVIEVEL